MPKPNTGTVRVLKNDDGKPQWHAKFSRTDGTRTPWEPIDPRIAIDDEAGARACAARMAPKIRRREVEATSGPETCDDYFKRLSKARAAEGIGGVKKDGHIWGKWISPRIGGRPISKVTRDEIEDIRNDLDTAVKKRLSIGLAEGTSGKTAANVWSVLRTTFKETVSARDRALRVRTDDPTSGHKPPLQTPDRAKTFVYPAEMAKLLACDDVPVEWRRVYAVASYSYVRPEELEALTWDDVDFEAGTISISKAIDARTGKAKPMPKTANAVRSVPIEATLRPLLVAMHAARASDAAPVLPVLGTLGDKYRAKLFREHLIAADVKRPRLTTDTLTLMGINFRSCRDSGITWLALAGVPLAAMQRRCGHQEVSQTLAYVKLAEDLAGAVGQPFPPIPTALHPEPRLRGAIAPNRPGSIPRPKFPGKTVGEGGFEPTHENARSAEDLAAESIATSSESSAPPPVRDHSRPLAPAPGAEPSDPADVVEGALAGALARAAAAGQWATVEVLARELGARRAAREASKGTGESKIIQLSDRRRG